MHPARTVPGEAPSHGSCDIPKRDHQSPPGQKRDEHNLQNCSTVCQRREGVSPESPKNGRVDGTRPCRATPTPVCPPAAHTCASPRVSSLCVSSTPPENAVLLSSLSPRPTGSRVTPAEGCTWTLTLRLPTWSQGRIPQVSARPHETVPIPNTHPVQTQAQGCHHPHF